MSNLTRSIIFLGIFVATSFVLDRLIPGGRMSFKTSLSVGVGLALVYFVALNKADERESYL